MSAVQFLFIMVLSAAIIWATLAWWIRPHIQALATDRDLWRDRCRTAELLLSQGDTSSVKLIDPADPDLNIFLKGTTDDYQA